jgi:hypothetical protein
MPKSLRINLPPTWSDHSAENPDGPPTYLRDSSDTPGPLQVSWAWYKSGKVPNPTDQDLIDLARASQKTFGGELLSTSSGACAIGRYGTVVLRTADMPRIQVWRLSNGRDIVTVTHICPVELEADEVAEAQLIVELLRIENRDEEPVQTKRSAGIVSSLLKLLGHDRNK